MPSRLVTLIRLAGATGRLSPRVPTPGEVGQGARCLGLSVLALAVATSSLTFNWVLFHRPQLNLFPEFAGGVVYLSDILALVGLSFWLVGWYLSPGWKPRLASWYVFTPLVFLVLLSTVSVFWAIDGAQAGYAAFHRVLLLALFFVLAGEANRALIPMVVALFAIGLLQAGVALAQVTQHSAVGLPVLGEITEGALGYGGVGSPRAYGLGFNPNPVGLFLAVVSVLAYGLLLLSRGGWRTRFLLALPFIVAFLGLEATGSRSAFLGWLLAVPLVSLLAWVGGDTPRLTTLKRIGLAVLLLLLAQGVVQYTSSIGTASGPDQPPLPSSGIASLSARLSFDSLSGGLRNRVADWRLSFPIIRDNLALGVGAGNHPVALKKQLSPNTFGGIFTPPHSVPLLLFAELGVLGGMAWALIMAAPLIWVLSKRHVQRFQFHGLVWLGPLLVLLFESLWDFPPWATQDGRVLMMAVLGLWAGGVATGFPPSREDDDPPGEPVSAAPNG